MTLFTSTLSKPLQVKKHHNDARVFTLRRYLNWSLTAEHPTTQKHFLKKWLRAYIVNYKAK